MHECPLTYPRPLLAAHLAADVALQANPAHALFSDLTARFQGLKAAHNRGYTADALRKDGTPLHIPELQNENNDKTVEELLAELGPDDPWALGKDEDIEINSLLKDARSALKTGAAKEEETAVAHQNTYTAQADVTPAIQTEPDSDNSPSSSPDANSKPLDLDTEAELTLQRLLDEIALDPSPSTILSQAVNDQVHVTELDPPPPYHAGPALDSVDDALARRFASLSVPETQAATSTRSDEDDDGLNLPTVPTTIQPHRTSGSSVNAAAADETEIWCIICLADAQVKCLGCDSDLYCTKCWMEGHRGKDAGFEERGHRAVTFMKGGGLKKARRLVGA